jgi:hypothetical protein
VSHQAIGHTAFAASRFLAAAMDVYVKPRFSLLFFYTGAIATTAATMKTSGSTGAAMIILVMFFEGPLFPQIFAQGLRGMGKHTKDASVLLTAAIGGGAVIPPVMFAALKIRNAQFAFCVIISAFAGGILYPIWLNAFPATRQLSDPMRDEDTRRESEAEEKRKWLAGEQKTRRFSKIKKRFSGYKNDQLPSVEHRERRSWPEGLAPRNGSMSIEPAEPAHLPSLCTYSNCSSSGSSDRR